MYIVVYNCMSIVVDMDNCMSIVVGMDIGGYEHVVPKVGVGPAGVERKRPFPVKARA